MNPGTFSQLSDTSVEAEAVQIELLRTLTPGQRAAKALSLSQQVINLSKRAIRRRHPHLREFELKILYLHHFYGPDIAEKVRTHLENKHPNDNQ